MDTVTEATFRVVGNKRTKQVTTTLDNVRTYSDLPVSLSLSIMVPLLYEHQVSVHRNLRNLVLDALQDNICAYFEGAPPSR
jgi:hypothetical protein